MLRVSDYAKFFGHFAMPFIFSISQKRALLKVGRVLTTLYYVKSCANRWFERSKSRSPRDTLDPLGFHPKPLNKDQNQQIKTGSILLLLKDHGVKKVINFVDCFSFRLCTFAAMLKMFKFELFSYFQI
jgi:hypothetical protein